MGVYLDYNASTPIDQRVLEKMVDIYKNHYGNADSRTHKFGMTTKSIVENARRQIGNLLGVPGEYVYFTSGSTESNNIAILGLEEYGCVSGKRHIITTAMEHKSVLEPCRYLEKKGFEVEYIMPHKDGRVSAEEILHHVRPDTLLVSVMHVNNETGTIQPVDEIGKALEETEVYFHVDASQSCGKLVEEIQNLSYDLLSVSAHKMYGPQGVGCLVMKNKNSGKTRVKPIMYGGGQERGIRPGTLPVALICGMGEAAAILLKEYRDNGRMFKDNQDMILNVLRENKIRYHVNGDLNFSMHNTLNISFENYDSEALMLALEAENLVGISNGSACTSHSYAPSYVLQSMGLDDKRIACSVRVSWGKEPIEKSVIMKMAEIIKGWQ